MRARTIFGAAIALLLAAAANAQVPMTGSFQASRACPAMPSIHAPPRSTDPLLEPGRSYPLVGKNKPDATFFQIVLDGARRWVDVRCGAAAESASSPGARASYVLALSWEPAFCRDHADRPECQPGHSPPGTLSLHGLWPQPRGNAYCNVDLALKQADQGHSWDRLPEPELSPATRQRLATVMPGLQSGLERHEWIVHGTCSGVPADAYFNRAAELAEQVNSTPLPSAFANNAGRSLATDAIRAAFDQAFGPGAGARVVVLCEGSGSARRITELDIALAGDVIGAAPVSDLIRSAAPVPPSCPGGVVTALRP